jgi:hypothetical protein
VAAWVGIVAGVVFIVAVVFFSGFVLGARSGGGHHGWGHHGGGGEFGMMFQQGPGPMFHRHWNPGGGVGPDGPGGPFGPGGPGGAGPGGPGGPGQPPSSSAPRPS